MSSTQVSNVQPPKSFDGTVVSVLIGDEDCKLSPEEHRFDEIRASLCQRPRGAWQTYCCENHYNMDPEKTLENVGMCYACFDASPSCRSDVKKIVKVKEPLFILRTGHDGALSRPELKDLVKEIVFAPKNVGIRLWREHEGGWTCDKYIVPDYTKRTGNRHRPEEDKWFLDFKCVADAEIGGKSGDPLRISRFLDSMVEVLKETECSH